MRAAELYDLTGVAYESIMVFQIAILECDWGEKGMETCPPNTGSSPYNHEMNENYIAFSRDGFHFNRPPAPRQPFAKLNASKQDNWNAWVRAMTCILTLHYFGATSN